MEAKFVFVWVDATIPTLAPHYRGPYLVIDRQSKCFCLQIGSKQDLVSVDCLKPAFRNDPITPALPLPQGKPLRCSMVPSSDPPLTFQEDTKESGFSSFHMFLCHLYLFVIIPTRPPEIEGSAPPFLCCSFWGEYCGEYECCLLSSEFAETQDNSVILSRFSLILDR